MGLHTFLRFMIYKSDRFFGKSVQAPRTLFFSSYENEKLTKLGIQTLFNLKREGRGRSVKISTMELWLLVLYALTVYALYITIQNDDEGIDDQDEDEYFVDSM